MLEIQSLSPSRIAIEALQIPIDGIHAKEDGACAYCGTVINAGDLCVKTDISKGFLDGRSMARGSSKVTCPHCAQTLKSTFLMSHGHGMFSAEGKQPFQKWKDVAHALNNPPKPPFIAVYATAKQQHIVWRAPINLSRDVFYVRVGLRNLRIRRVMLEAIKEACRVLGQVLIDHGKINAHEKTLPHPFISLSPDLKEVATGMIQPSLFHDDVWHESLKPHLDVIQSMTLGEIWAMRFILTPLAGE